MCPQSEMNTLLIRAALVLLMAFGLFGFGYVKGERSKQSVIDAMNNAQVIAKQQLDDKNKKIDEIQIKLDATIKNINDLGIENAKAHSENIGLRSDLDANRKRLYVAIAANNRAKEGSNQASAGLDNQSTTTAQLDPAVASNLVQLTDTGDQAIRRLNACIAAYQAAQEAEK